MKRMITVHTEPEYNVTIGKNLKAFESLGDARLFILCDENVYLLYKDTFNVKNGVIYTFPAGEKSKTMDTAVKILTAMAENGFGRNDTLVAFGSGYRFLFGGSTSGKRVNERSAMQMTAVYSCVRILSEAAVPPAGRPAARSVPLLRQSRLRSPPEKPAGR